MEEEIKAEFINCGFSLDNEQEILKTCITFCINYKLKPSDLVSSWEVYYLNRQLDESTVQNAEMDGFLLHLQNEQKEAILKEEPNLHIYFSKDLIASGPFTTIDNLMFEPLMELLAYARRKPPQLLILLGPFVDSEHPDIKKGIVDRSFDDIFHVEILRRLEDYVEYMGSNARVLIVPSTRDANHDFVFPQPALEMHPPNLKHQITSLRNPGIFEANQVRVGCCTVDIIKQLSGEEMSCNPADGTPSDRMSRLASHILNRHSFYPLYPPAEDVPLDFSLASEPLHIPFIPDILILPSDMKYFIKVQVVYLGGSSEGEEQNKCICINPGRLAKGEGGGTFVELNYCGSPDKINASVIGI